MPPFRTTQQGFRVVTHRAGGSPIGWRTTGVAIVLLLASCQSTEPTPTAAESSTDVDTGRQPSVTLSDDATAVLDGDFPVALADDLIATVDHLSARGAQLAVRLADGSSFTYSENPVPTASPLADIGSVDKTFTAALVLLIVEERLVGLDDSVDEWIDAPAVTVRQLLNHTSGIASDDPTLPAVCDPGSCQSYSNSGFHYLKDLVEAVTGQEYAAALRERVLDPLGLTRTFYPAQEQARGPAAVGYQNERPEAALDVATERVGLVSTADDVTRFAAALFSGDLLGPGSRSSMLDFDAALALGGSNECRPYGMGVERDTVEGLGPVWGHGGNAGSFRTALLHFPESGTSAAVVVNDGSPLIGDYVRSVETALARHLPAARTEAGCDHDIAMTDGSSTAIVSTRRGFDGLPAVSPDGRTVAGSSDFGDETDIVLYDLDAGTSRRIALDGNQPAPRWSPDGSHLLFASDQDGDPELHLLTMATNEDRVLTDNDVDDVVASFSPDGSRIVMMRGVGPSHQLWVTDADGGRQHRIPGSPDDVNWPAWSPDGTQIVYTSGGVPFIIDAAGGDPFRIPIKQVRVVDLPSWAPGDDILFGSDGDLWSVAPDGSALTRLTSTSTVEEAPVRSPTGDIVFQLQHRS